MAHNILPLFFQHLSSQLRSQTLAAAADSSEFSRSLTGLAGQKMWVALKIVLVTTRVEADGNKEEEGCLLPGTQNPPHPTHPTSWKPANKVPLLVEKAKRPLTGCAVENASCHNRHSEGLEQHGRFCWGAVVTPVGHFRCGDTSLSSSGGSHTLQSEMIGLTEVACMAKLFSPLNGLLLRQNKGLTVLGQIERDSQKCKCKPDQQYTVYMRAM